MRTAAGRGVATARSPGHTPGRFGPAADKEPIVLDSRIDPTQLLLYLFPSCGADLDKLQSSFFPVAPATLIVFVGTRTGTAIHPEQQAHRSAILTVPLSRIRKLFFGMTVPSSEFAPRDQSLDFHNRGERLAIYLTLLHRKCGGQKLLESFAIEAGMGTHARLCYCVNSRIGLMPTGTVPLTL